MEPASSFSAESLRDERVKLVRSIRALSSDNIAQNIVRGQYQEGQIAKKPCLAYRAEKGVSPDSNVETYVAARLFIDNWRWKDVPFFLRAGKRLARKLSEVAISFKPVPHSPFFPMLSAELGRNLLILRLQPDESVTLALSIKSPGPKLCIQTHALHFSYAEIFGQEMPEAYERLLLDAMLGDQTLFIRADSNLVSWALFEPVIAAWYGPRASQDDLHFYAAGSWGPSQAGALFSGLPGAAWFEPQP
jgi:glucose-6-phosphate 1-dehydrogenase